MNRLILLCLLTTAAACAESSPTAPVASARIDPAGVYDLATVDGAELPLVVAVADSSYTEIQSATLVIAPDGAYRDEFVTAMVRGHSFTLRTKVSVGQWAVSTDGVTLVGHSRDDTLASSPDGATLLDAVVDDLVLTYRKR
jgi:hypothetical protein